MGRKKKFTGEVKPFCYYCEREFEQESVLVQHQRVKHFKCQLCNKKLDHAMHKETLTKLENCATGREAPDLQIHGMEGVPIDFIERKRRVLVEAHGKKQEVRKLGINKYTHDMLSKARFHPRFHELEKMVGLGPEFAWKTGSAPAKSVGEEKSGPKCC